MNGIDEQQRFGRDHRWARERMSDYLDDDLPGERRARMDHHLRQCAACRALLEGLSRSIDALHRLAAPADGPSSVEIAALVEARLTPRR